MTEQHGLTAAERRMLDIARRYGWHTLATREEYATARSLAAKGYGEAVNGIGGHDGSFRVKRTKSLRGVR